MTAPVPASTGRRPELEAITCPCLHGTLAAELDQQRRLVQRAITGDAEAFAELYDAQVDDVYRYLLAWTGDQGRAEALTQSVFRNALRWLPLVAWRQSELGGWLLGMARDAIVEQRESAWERVGEPGLAAAGAGVEQAAPGADGDRLHRAVAELDDEEREVIVLRFLLDHSVMHAAYLMGVSPGAVTALQLRACSSLASLLSRETLP